MGITNPREPNDSQPTNENKENDAEVGQLFMLAGREEFAHANLLFSASKSLLYSLETVNTIVIMSKYRTYDS